MSQRPPDYLCLPPDNLPKRLARLRKRGDVVRKYEEIARELHASLMTDISSGRRRAAVIHFRPFLEYCLNAIYVAYPASEDELDRRRLPKNLVEAAKQTINHWKLSVNESELKTLQRRYEQMSQAVHGSRCALKELDTLAGDWTLWIQSESRKLLEIVEEADSRLNGHRG